jgi:hypothetical protein
MFIKDYKGNYNAVVHIEIRDAFDEFHEPMGEYPYKLLLYVLDVEEVHVKLNLERVEEFKDKETRDFYLKEVLKIGKI